DVGWNDWEEIDRVALPTGGPTNFGWPCYEGPDRQPGYAAANLAVCQGLYAGGGVTQPYAAYQHTAPVGTGCPTGGSSVTGLAFYPAGGGPYPAQYDGALFFADYSRRCIWAMLAGADGLPDPANIVTFASGVPGPVELAVGPGNELYYVDLGGGTVRRLRYYAGNQPPSAVITATATSGTAPLPVTLSAADSTDADPAD